MRLSLTACADVADLLTSAAMSPVYAAAANIFGRKPTLFACYLVFAIGSACVARILATLT